MADRVSFGGIGAVVATFAVQEGVKGGQVVKLTGNGQAGPCESGDLFCGVALEPRAGFGAVQVRGFVEVPTSEKLSPGWAELTADGSGGVRAAGEGQGVRTLVVSAASDSEAVVCL